MTKLMAVLCEVFLIMLIRTQDKPKHTLEDDALQFVFNVLDFLNY